jgi:hypothetical protein
LEISFENRLQDELERPLDHTVTNGRDGQRELHTNTVSFWDWLRSGILFIHFAGKASQY